MKNTLENPKVINFTAKKAEIQRKQDEALIESVRLLLSDLKQKVEKYSKWAKEARKLGDKESVKRYEEEIAGFTESIKKGEDLIAEGLLINEQLDED